MKRFFCCLIILHLVVFSVPAYSMQPNGGNQQMMVRPVGIWPALNVAGNMIVQQTIPCVVELSSEILYWALAFGSVGVGSGFVVGGIRWLLGYHH
jgi:hypothetical protein